MLAALACFLPGHGCSSINSSSVACASTVAAGRGYFLCTQLNSITILKRSPVSARDHLFKKWLREYQMSTSLVHDRNIKVSDLHRLIFLNC